MTKIRSETMAAAEAVEWVVEEAVAEATARLQSRIDALTAELEMLRDDAAPLYCPTCRAGPGRRRGGAEGDRGVGPRIGHRHGGRGGPAQDQPTTHGGEMTHPFYTNPLAVAWMAQQYGMSFSPRLNTGEINWHCRYPSRGVYSFAWEPAPPAAWGQYFVHPDSLHLLEPRVADIILDPRDQGHMPKMWQVQPHYVGHSKVRCDQFAKIIQRNGQPFHWPEREPDGQAEA